MGDGKGRRLWRGLGGSGVRMDRKGTLRYIWSMGCITEDIWFTSSAIA